MIPPHILDAIRATPLAPIVADYVTLRKSGQGRLVGPCPFHRERTPSFTVYEDHWHCFGCGLSGDVIAFLMRIQSVPYIEAVKYLAERLGLRYEDKWVSRKHAAAAKVARAADAVEAEFAAWWWARNDAMLQAAVYDALADAEWAECCGRDPEPHYDWAECCGRQLMHWHQAITETKRAVFKPTVADRRQWVAEAPARAEEAEYRKSLKEYVRYVYELNIKRAEVQGYKDPGEFAIRFPAAFRRCADAALKVGVL
jgi:hypothetical protein